jgi:hypothetical protein
MKLLISAFLIIGFHFNSLSQEIIETEEVEIGCLILGRGVSGEKIITNNSDYQSLLEHRSPHPNCVDYQLPIIDFEKHTLLSYVGGAGGCDTPEVSYEVERESEQINVNIQITEFGNCLPLHPVIIRVLIPRIESNSQVEFHVETEIKEK